VEEEIFIDEADHHLEESEAEVEVDLIEEEDVIIKILDLQDQGMEDEVEA